MKICPNCGAECVDEAVICVQCGHKFENKKIKNQFKENNKGLQMNTEKTVTESSVWINVSEIILIIANLANLLLSFYSFTYLYIIVSFVSFFVSVICLFLTRKANMNRMIAVAVEFVFLCVAASVLCLILL